MTLAVGTTLQNGTYVIDAWVAEDTIGPVYLAMYVPQGQWIQLRVLGSRNPMALPDISERQAFYQYLEQVVDLQDPTFPSHLGGFEEEGVCYQILAIPTGTPLDRLVTPAQPLPPQASLTFIRQLVTSLQALRPLGWAGLRLAPDQVWYTLDDQVLKLIGFDLPPSLAAAADPAGPTRSPEAALVQGLTHLLYFMLTGQRAEATRAPLAVNLRHHCPGLPTSLDTVLELGQPQNQPWPTVTLAEWEALLPLPETLPANPLPTPTAQPTIQPTAQPTVQPTAQQPTAPATVVVGRNRPPAPQYSDTQPEAQVLAPAARRPASLALVLTGLIATVSGLSFGFYTRLQPASSTGQERLSPHQSFPPLPNWNSNTTLWQPWEDAPTRRSRPDYGDPPPGAAPVPDFAPDPQEPAAPPPAVERRPASVPSASPGPSVPRESPVEPWVAPEPAMPTEPDALPATEPAPAPAPAAPPAPLEPPPQPRPDAGAAPPPLVAPPMPGAPAPSSS
ncbi:MAG: hypothetical protein EA368_08650 [Leptolyngbya sp. DLM2.Bin27]|nr:MAG: hypothetical protein EA368_08650 [Leptolyngbya sp. DLM2.Bin27]